MIIYHFFCAFSTKFDIPSCYAFYERLVNYMNLFEGFALNFVFIIFPMLLYLFYLIQTSNIGKKDNDLFLDFAFITSFYFCIRYGITFFPIPTMFFITIPLFLAYQKHHSICAIAFSAILLSVQVTYYQKSFLLFIGIYFLYFILYECYYYKKLREKRMMLYFLILNVLSNIFYMIYTGKLSGMTDIQIPLLMLATFLISYISFRFIEKGNEIINFHISLKEIEKQKQFQNSLFKITHEIKNPIAVCKGYLDMFDTNNPEHSKKYIPIMKEEIERTLVLLQDFLATNHVKINPEEMDMNLLLEEVIHNFKPILKQHHIKLDAQIKDEEYYMMGDYYRLNQVLINIFKNAVEAMKENGRLEIYTKVNHHQLMIYVKDNGEGISDEHLNKIAEPFFTTKEHGTGLGVGLSMEIVKKHHGTMKYHSKVGNGTTVILTFPLLAIYE